MQRTPALLVLAAALLFGTTGTAQELGPEGASPPVVGAARILVGGALLLAFAAATGALRGARWDRRLVAVSALGVAGYQVCFFAGVDATGVAIGTIVALGSAPALTGLLEWALGRGRPGGRWAAATALATAGATLLVASGESIGVDAAGVVLALGAGLSYAVYTVAGKAQLDQGHGPEAVMAAAFSAGAVLLLPVLVVGDSAFLAGGAGLATVAYLGVFPTAVAYVFFARGLQTLPAASVATLTLAEPLTAATLGVVVLGERPSAWAAAGAALVLSGLLAIVTTSRKERDVFGAAA
jgi:DME family drug/metabolite transporter